MANLIMPSTGGTVPFTVSGYGTTQVQASQPTVAECALLFSVDQLFRSRMPEHVFVPDGMVRPDHWARDKNDATGARVLLLEYENVSFRVAIAGSPSVELFDDELLPQALAATYSLRIWFYRDDPLPSTELVADQLCAKVLRRMSAIGNSLLQVGGSYVEGAVISGDEA